MKRLALCLLFLAPLTLSAETNSHSPFPDFTDVLLIEENHEINIYVDGGRKDSVRSLQASLDELPALKKREGVLLRFDPKTIPLQRAAALAESIYRCGVPVVYLYDSTTQHTQTEIATDPYLAGLSRMPRYNRFLRVLDIGSFLLLPDGPQRKGQVSAPSAFGPVVLSCAVILLAAGSYIAGLYISRLRSPWWMLGYLIPVLLTGVIAIARWIPTLEMRMPFRVLMAERREYLIMSIATALLLSVPAARLKRRSTAILATAFAAVFVVHFSVLPYLLPAFNRPELLSLQTNFDRYGICLQSTGYTCGPAAAVSALREFDVAAEEGELAVAAYSTSSAGTPPELLCRAIMKLYGDRQIQCEFRSFTKAEELKESLPVLAVVKFGFLVDHYVTVLRVTDQYVTVGDPAVGMRVLSVKDFESEWRNQGITFHLQAPVGRPGTGSIPLEPQG